MAAIPGGHPRTSAASAASPWLCSASCGFPGLAGGPQHGLARRSGEIPAGGLRICYADPGRCRGACSPWPTPAVLTSSAPSASRADPATAEYVGVWVPHSSSLDEPFAAYGLWLKLSGGRR
jgi:hypothetical protein